MSQPRLVTNRLLHLLSGGLSGLDCCNLFVSQIELFRSLFTPQDTVIVVNRRRADISLAEIDGSVSLDRKRYLSMDPTLHRDENCVLLF